MSFKYRTKDDDIRELHFKLPKALMYEEQYKKLSANAKLLYAMLNDRSNLSMKNDWYDKFNRAFIICSIDEIEIFLNCARGSANKYLKELINFDLVKKAKASEMEIGEIENNTMDIENLNDSNANILYVGYVDTSNETLEKHLDSHFENLKQLRKKRKKERKERENRKKEKEALFKNCTMPENTNVDNNKSMKASNCKDSTKNELTLVQNLHGSNTDFSNTDSVVVVNMGYKRIPNRTLTEFEKIQINQNLTISEKILEIQKIKNIDLKEIALLEKFMSGFILVSDAQLNMLKKFDYKVADIALDDTIAQCGETFSYFKKVYEGKEQEDINNMLDEIGVSASYVGASTTIKKYETNINKENETSTEEINLNEEDKENNNDFGKEFYEKAVATNWEISMPTYIIAKTYANNNNLFYPKEEFVKFI